MKRLLCLILCLMLMLPTALAEEAPALRMADLIRVLPELLEGATVAFEAPETGRYALTLHPGREDFARIDLPSGALYATQEGIFLSDGESVSCSRWTDLITETTALEPEAIALMAQEIAADAQTVWTALVNEFQLSMPIYVGGSEDDGFLTASVRVDTEQFMNMLYRVLDEEAIAVNNILRKLGNILGQPIYFSASQLSNELYRLAWELGLTRAGEILNLSFGASMVDDSAAMTLLATVGSARLSVTLHNGEVSGELSDRNGQPLCRISGTAVIEEGVHIALVVEDARATASFEPIHFHFAATEDGFTALLTGDDFTLSGALSDMGLTANLNARFMEASFNFSSNDATRLYFATPDCSFTGSYRTQQEWIPDDSLRWGGHYVSQPVIDLRMIVDRQDISFHFDHEDGVEVSLRGFGPSLIFGRITADLNYISLEADSTQLTIVDMGSLEPGVGLIRVQLYSAEESREFILRFYAQATDLVRIDVIEEEETIASLILDSRAQYIPTPRVTEYALLDATALGEALAEFFTNGVIPTLDTNSSVILTSEPTRTIMITPEPTPIPTPKGAAQVTATPTLTPTPTPTPTPMPTATPLPFGALTIDGEAVAVMNIPEGYGPDNFAEPAYNAMSLLNSFYEAINSIYVSMIEDVTAEEMMATLEKYSFYNEMTPVRTATIGGHSLQYRYVKDTYVDDYGYPNHYSALVMYKNMTSEDCIHISLTSRYEAEPSILPSEAELLAEADEILSCLTLFK